MSEFHVDPPKACQVLYDNYYMLSIAGPRYHRKAEKLHIALHRGFRTQDQALHFYKQYIAEKEKAGIPTSATIARINEPLILTQDPKNLSNPDYQTRKLRDIFADLDGYRRKERVKLTDRQKELKKENVEQKHTSLKRQQDKELEWAGKRQVEEKAAPFAELDQKEGRDYNTEDEVIVADGENKVEKVSLEKYAKEMEEKTVARVDAEVLESQLQELSTPISLPSRNSTALVQFIYSIADVMLREPVIIVIGFFSSPADLKQYATEYIESEPAHLYTHLVPVPTEVWKSPYVDTKNFQHRIYPKSAEFLQQYHDGKRQVAQEKQEALQRHRQTQKVLEHRTKVQLRSAAPISYSSIDFDVHVNTDVATLFRDPTVRPGMLRPEDGPSPPRPFGDIPNALPFSELAS